MLAPKQDENFFAYWISFWPTAPFFGVAWRFEKMAPFAGFYAPSSVMAGMARAGAAEAAKAAEETVEAVEHAAEIVEEAVAEVVVETEFEATIDAEPVAPPPARPAALLGEKPEAVDDLKLIKGVGPKLEQMLNDLGVFTFAQIAAFDATDCAWVEAQIAAARARPLPEDWAEQARAFA